MIKTISQRGLLYSVGIVINRIVPEQLFRLCIFRVFELEYPNDHTSPTPDATFEYRWCETEDDFATAKELTYFETRDDTALERYAACLVYDGEETVGGVWRAEKWFVEENLGVRILLAPGHAWIFAALVAKSHRGYGIYKQLLSAVMRDNPDSTHYASINPFNKPSIAAHRPFIRSTVGTCIAMRFFSIVFCLTRGGLQQDRLVTFSSNESPIEIRFTS